MAQGRSLLRWVFNNFLNSIKPKNVWGEFKGRDEFGIEYYEDSSTRRGKLPARWFAPPKGVESCPKLPVEWESWLRHKRKLPPTEEEIHLNKLRRMKTIENAMKLENTQKKENELNEVKPFNKPAYPIYEGFSTGPNFPETNNDKQ